MNNMTDAEREARWERQDDARLLARAKAIEADKTRLANAKLGAKELLAEEQERLDGLSKVAGTKNPVKSQPKRQSSPQVQPTINTPSYDFNNFPTTPKF